MRKGIVTLALMVTVFSLLLGGLRCHPYYQYTNSNIIHLSIDSSAHDTLKIAMIGDSWAAYHQDYDTILQKMLTNDSLLVAVKSKGNVGAKSREVYERFSSTTKPILDWHPDYCVILAGINDAVAKLGARFYIYHYSLIIRQLLNEDIKPIVLEIPEVNYKAIAYRESVFKRIHHIASAMLMDSELYTFQKYRSALSDFVVNSGLKDSVIYISVNQWNPSGYKDKRDLYQSDETHLNAKGYHLLDSCIASRIIIDNKQENEQDKNIRSH